MSRASSLHGKHSSLSLGCLLLAEGAHRLECKPVERPGSSNEAIWSDENGDGTARSEGIRDAPLLVPDICPSLSVARNGLSDETRLNRKTRSGRDLEKVFQLPGPLWAESNEKEVMGQGAELPVKPGRAQLHVGQAVADSKG